jgi:hypothetical protein
MTETKINALKLGLAGGVIGAIVTFLSTIVGIYGLSQAADSMANTMWANYGYSVTWGGAFIGLIIGFVYAFVLVWTVAMIYNWLLKKS